MKTMKRCSAIKLRLGAGAAVALLTAGMYAASLAGLAAADPKPEKSAAAAEKTEKKAEKKKLTGAQLYAIHCNRCHPERYPTEWTASEWKTIMLEMRVRANLPAEQAKAILKYLQDESGK